MGNPLDLFLAEICQNGYEPLRGVVIGSAKWESLCYNGESRSKASGGYKLTQNPDGSVSGNYGSSKDPAGFRFWRSDSEKELSWSEIAEQKLAREKHWSYLTEWKLARQEKIGRRLAAVFKRLPEAVDHPYLTDKQIRPYSAKLRAKGNELIIPGYGPDGKLHSIQRIAQTEIGKKSDKWYFSGANRKGVYLPLAKTGEDLSVLLLVEGWATGCTVREATGLPVLVCFDSGNLLKIAVLMKKKYPASRIVFVADNDDWTFAPGKKPKEIDKDKIPGDDPRWAHWRQDGLLYNPGLEAAKAAALKIGGATVIYSEFKPEDTGPKPTDANDAATLYGQEYVRDLITGVIAQRLEQGAHNALVVSSNPTHPPTDEIPAREEAPHGEEPPVTSDLQSPMGGDVEMGGIPRSQRDMDMNFRVLGYNEGTYFYFPYALRQIVRLTASAHSMINLVQLDDLGEWERPWRDSNGKLMEKHPTIAVAAFDRLKRLAITRGVFAEENRVRGAGAWIDDGRVILHCGDRLYVDGDYRQFDELDTKFTYVAAHKALKPARIPLSNAEAYKLRKICEEPTWENPLSGSLLAGWLVIAPVCAALTYRPHIYVSGESDSGKSTIMEKIIKPVLGDSALCLDGGTTEPSVRDEMAYDGRPLVYDEAEGSNTMTGVIGLARKASTGAVVKKFGQRPFKARFAACFSAINPPVNKTADENRISFMHLKKNRRPDAMVHYDNLLRMIDETITTDFSERMLARTLQNMNSLLANIRIFQRAVRQSTGAARASWQIGTMLAGLYMLHSTEIISEQSAAEWVQKHSWTDHTVIGQEADPVRLVQHIASALVRYAKTGADISIGELIGMTAQDKDIAADRLLRNYGIAVRENTVDIANKSANFARLLKETEWRDGWARTLSDIEGAKKLVIAYFAPALKTSAVSLPLSSFVEIEHAVMKLGTSGEAAEEEIEF